MARAIDGALAEIGADASYIAICGGACGGDLLFAEAASRRDCHVWLYLPFSRAQFLERSVDIGGSDWRRRFEAIERIADHEVITLASPDDADAFSANNARMLEAARAVQRPDQALHFICLWDGKDGDGPGGTGDMIEHVVDAGAIVRRIDPHAL